jgi:transcriptional regulator with GAF, ATPase, and Fis domain
VTKGALQEASDASQCQLIQDALKKMTAGNKTKAAALLGLQRTTLIERMRRLGIPYFASQKKVV